MSSLTVYEEPTRTTCRTPLTGRGVDCESAERVLELL